MELKKGYKQTLAGIIPEDWEVKELHQIAKFINGKAHEMFIDEKGDYKVVNSKFVSSEGNVFKLSSTLICPLNVGDITMVMSDIPNGKALAKCFLIDQNNTYTLNQRICALTPFEDSPSYLFKTLNRNKYFLAFDSGTGQTNLRRQEVLSCPVILPSKKEQIAIADALTDADTYITSLEKLIEKKRQIKQGVMQELLKPKDGWVSYKLEEICVIKKGQQLNKNTLTQDGDFPVMNGGVSPSGFTSQSNQNENTIIISEGGNSCGFVNFIKTKFWQGGHCYSIETRLHTDFLFHLMKFKEKEIMALRVGSGLPNIQLKRLYTFHISIPEKKIQIELAEIFNSFDLEIKILIEKLNKIKELEKSMMQNLLTGKIRLL